MCIRDRQCAVATASANEAEWALWRAKNHKAQVDAQWIALCENRPVAPHQAPEETVVELSAARTTSSMCACCTTLSSVRQQASRMNTAVRCLACGRNNAASPGSTLDTRQELCMLNAEFLVQHDRRAKAVLAEEVARQNRGSSILTKCSRPIPAKIKKKIYPPNVGLEPTTTRLRVLRSAD